MMNVVMDQEGDCQPRDLSMKYIKRLKPIPPPLNLGDNSNALKEFAILATSPKSPLMQKNLPFRKRAHSLPGFSDVTAQPFVAVPPVESTDCTTSVIIQNISNQASNVCTNVINTFESTSSQNVGKSQIGEVQMSSKETECKEKVNLNAASVSPLPCIVQPQNQSSSPSWSQSVVQFVPSVSSVLLSPIGSSREELCNPVNMNPWPVPAWHCFQPGTLIKLEVPSTGINDSGVYRLAEELGSSDWVGALKVNEIEEDLSTVQTCINFCCLGTGIFITAQCHALHTFFVKNKGWCAVYPEHVAMRYHVICLPLERGDICWPPQTLSPDVCERFKRFSFPPEEMTVPSPFILSPPSSPCKKPSDSDRPKRPMNAFMLFAKRYRLELIQMHPGKDNRAISVILGEAWRKLPAADKQEYVLEARAMAQEQKRLYPDCWKRKRSHSTS